MIIRPVEFNEWKKPIQLSTQLFKFMPLWKRILLTVKLPLSLVVMKVYHGETILVAEEENEIIGIVIAKLEGNLAYIEGTVVDRDHRRKGVSNTLKEAIHKKLKKLGAEKAVTQIEPGNDAALRMAYSQGYSQRDNPKYFARALTENDIDSLSNHSLESIMACTYPARG